MVKKEKQEQTRQLVQELPEVKEDEIDEIIMEFFREDIAQEAELAAEREEKRGE